MRILLVNNLYPPLLTGGAERSVAELAAGFVYRGHEVAVLTLAPASGPPVLASSRVHRFVATRDPWPFSAEWADAGPMTKLRWHVVEGMRLQGLRELRGAVAFFRPDVVSSHVITGFGPLAWLGVPQSVPLAHTIRDFYLLCYRSTLERSGHRCETRCTSCKVLTWSRQRAARRPDAFIGVSRRVLELHAKTIEQKRTFVVGNRPQLETLVKDRRIERIRRVGFLGFVDERKGAGVILDAMSQRNWDLSIAFAGSGDPRLIRRIANAGANVTYEGPLPAATFFDGLDLLVVPSQWEEPFGRVAAEAASIGLPVIVSAVGGLPEAVRGHSHAMTVENYTSSDAWARALLRAVQDWTDVEVGSSRSAKVGDPADSYIRIFKDLVRSSPCSHV